MQLKINNIKIDLVLILIGICPIFFVSDNLNPLEIIRSQRTIFFLIASMMIIASCHANRYIAAFLLLSLFHLILFPSVDYFENRIKFLFCGAFVYHFVYRSYSSENYKYVLFWVTSATVAIATLQYFGKDIFFYAKLETPGLMILPGYMGQFCAIIGPIIASIHPALLVVPIIGLMLSKSIVSIFAFCISMLFFCYFKSKKLFVGLLLVALIALPFIAKKDFDSGQWERRITVWKMVSSKAFRSPFVGYGIGNYKKSLFMEWSYKDVSHFFQMNWKAENIKPLNDKIREIAEEGGFDTTRLDLHNNLKHKMDEMRGKGLHSYIWDHPHNEYLLIWYEYGLIGLLLLIFYIGDILKRFHSAIFNYIPFPTHKHTIALMASFLSVLILCNAHFTLYLPVTMPVAIVLIAMLDRELSCG